MWLCACLCDGVGGSLAQATEPCTLSKTTCVRVFKLSPLILSLFFHCKRPCHAVLETLCVGVASEQPAWCSLFLLLLQLVQEGRMMS